MIKLAEEDESYDEKTVDQIVTRLKDKYQERGYKEEEKEEVSLKKKIKEEEETKISEKGPEDLVEHDKPILQMIGKIYSSLGFLKKVSGKMESLPFAQTLELDLKSADMDLNTGQYCAIAFIFTIIGAIIIAGFGLLVAFLFLQETLLMVLVVFLALFIGFFFAMFVTMQYPSNSANQRGREIDKVLAFGLRHLATEVKAGVSIHKAMESVAESNYGELSIEFQRTLDKIEKGVSTQDALEEMATRAPSEDLTTALSHIRRTLRTGGKVSKIIETIADNISFRLRMKTRDFVQRLNLIGLFYMMVGVIFPVFVSVLAGIFNAIPRVGMTGVLGVEVLFLIYFILIPMALGMILYVIKVMQPM